MEPILAKADNYSFLKKLVENVKQTKDAQAPDDQEVNKVDITPPSPPSTWPSPLTLRQNGNPVPKRWFSS